jgi:CheY-like chemotaxis protein
MCPRAARRHRILVVEDVQETRNAIRELLWHDGYQVDAAQDEGEAFEQIRRNRPDLILVSLQGAADQLIATSKRIRRCHQLGRQPPIVIFSAWTVPQGVEEKLSDNIYLTAPDSFNQLRQLVTRLLRGARPMA